MKQKILIGIAVFAAALILVVGGLVAFASTLPRDHTASTSIAIDAPPDRVWTTIRDLGRMHQWAPDVTALQRIPGPQPAYRMDSDDGVLTYVIAKETPGELLVVELTSDPPVFGGRWIWSLKPTESGTQLTLTEDGWVDPLLFRLIMTAGGMYDDTVIATSEALKAHLEG